MKLNRIMSLCFVAILTLSALALVIAVFQPGTAQADPGGGFISKASPIVVAAGTTAYTSTPNISLTTVNVFDYGAVQIQVAQVVTGAGVLTVIPQFSNATTLNCSTATPWFTATQYLIYPAYTVASQAITSTGVLTMTTSTSTGSLTTGISDLSLAVTGSDTVGREIPVMGRCLRLKLLFSASGQTYTPTITVRPVNRQ
jgi:hypothetical protein